MKETIEAQILKVLDTWMEAFNRLDVVAWEKTFHFPHYRSEYTFSSVVLLEKLSLKQWLK